MIALAKPKRRCTRHLPPPIDQVVVEYVTVPPSAKAKHARGMAALLRVGGADEVEVLRPILARLDHLGKGDQTRV